MLWINRKKLLELIEEAYNKGLSGAADSLERVSQDLLVKALPKKMGFRIFSIAQLQKIPSGKRIFHPLLGEGEVCLFMGKIAVSFKEKVEIVDQDNYLIWSYPLAQVNTKEYNEVL